jgi:hypothetical protein
MTPFWGSTPTFAYIVSVHVTPSLHCEHLPRLNFDFDADDPDADTDQAFEIDTNSDYAVHSDAGPDTDPDPASPNHAKSWGSAYPDPQH